MGFNNDVYIEKYVHVFGLNRLTRKIHDATVSKTSTWIAKVMYPQH